MVHEPHGSIADADAVPDRWGDRPPRLFRQPVEPPPPLGTLAERDTVRGFRREWLSRLDASGSRRLGSLRATVRAWAGRVTGRADRRLLFALAGATDAVAEQCDSVVGRLSRQEDLASEVVVVLGEEVTRLRAEVIRLRDMVAVLEHQRGG